MPTLFRSGKVMIRMFRDDHDPPHFHITTPDLEMVIVLSNFSTLRGNIRRRDYEIAMAWARVNIEVLRKTWNELND
jgi:hypothetical protein